MISERDLQAAAKEYEKLMLDSLPDAEACAFTFSRKFERRMKKLVSRTDHPLRCRIQTVAACFLLAVFLGGGSLITFSTEARAAFFGWVKEFHESIFEYHYAGGSQLAPEGTAYRPAWVPVGYEMVSEYHDAAGGDIEYKKGNGDILSFSWFMDNSSTTVQVRPETSEMKDVFVKECPAELYLEENDGKNSVLIWYDEEKDILFAIAAPLDEDGMIQIAESVDFLNSK